MDSAVAIFIVLAIVFVAGLVIALPVMLLWNWLMPDLFGLVEVTYWQAYGLYILCTLLFKSSYSSD